MITARDIEPGQYRSYDKPRADLTVTLTRYNLATDIMYLEWFYHDDGDLRCQHTPGVNQWHMTPALYVINELGVLV